MDMTRVNSNESLPTTVASVDETVGSASTTRRANPAPPPVSLDFLADDERWARKMGLNNPQNEESEEEKRNAENKNNGNDEDDCDDGNEILRQIKMRGMEERRGNHASKEFEGLTDPLQPVSQAAYGQIQPPDLEYGVMGPDWGGGLVGGTYDENLAVAVAVDEEEEFGKFYHAIEYDPDAKPPLRKNRRFQVYGVLACIIVVCIAIAGTVSGVILSGRKGDSFTTMSPTATPTSSPTGAREALFRQQLRIDVGDIVDDPASAQYAALQWMIYDDPHNLAVTAANLLQRFLVVSFYFETTNNGERRWRSCNPPDLSIGEDAACTLQKFVSEENGVETYQPQPATR